MKDICSVILVLCLVQFSLSSDAVIITIKGKMEEPVCEGESYKIYIPLTADSPATDVFTLPLVSPAKQQVSCQAVLEASTKYPLKSTDPYLVCSLNVNSFLLYNAKVEFYPTYEWDKIKIEGWETYIGAAPVVSEHATCPVPDFEFTGLEKLEDACDVTYPDYHSLTGQGSLNIKKTQTQALTSTDVQLDFDLYVYMNSQLVTAKCALAYNQANSDDIVANFKCLAKGEVNFQYPSQMVATGENKSKYLYVEGIGSVNLPVSCNTPTPTPSFSSWVSLSWLLIVGLLLL